MDRVILHIDMNNFYASVETLYDPSLKDIPMAVGGDKERRHGIVLAKNMLAKAKGVKTAEALWEAERKCPGIKFVPPHFERYAKYSRLAKEIYMQYTDMVESFGLDECWLDVTGSRRLFGSGREIAEEIRARVKDELGLTVSIGVSFNKIFAKLGSDYKKPDAVTAFTRENFKELVWPLPAADLLFVGKSTQEALRKYGIYTIGDAAKADRKLLKRLFGKAGEQLSMYANGEDRSPVRRVNEHEEIKSIGNSTAYHSTHCTSNACHHTKSNTHVRELANTFILCGFFSYIIASLLLIGITFLHTLLGNCLRVNNHLLCFSLLFNNTNSLVELRFGNICILTEMQFFEFFVLRITVWLDDSGHIEPFELNTIFEEIRNKAVSNIC